MESTRKGNWMSMFIYLFCLCPLDLTIKLNFNISEAAYCEGKKSSPGPARCAHPLLHRVNSNIYQAELPVRLNVHFNNLIHGASAINEQKVKADQSNHSVKFIDQAKKRYIVYHFGDTSEVLWTLHCRTHSISQRYQYFFVLESLFLWVWFWSLNFSVGELSEFIMW